MRVVDSTLALEFELVLFSRLSSPERSTFVGVATGFELVTPTGSCKG